MQLSADVLKKIAAPDIRRKLTVALDVTDQTVVRYIKDNSDDLTKAAALKIIRQVTGLTDEQILVEEVQAVPAG
jgi:hypothetical protein